jgi:hypothetical protein
MKFPENPREGSQAHEDALQRLDAARGEQRERSDAHDAAQDTADEPAAASELARAKDELAAREAWVKWIERGY